MAAHIWSPNPTAMEGWMIETPIRAKGSPANLWVHWAGLSADWDNFPPDVRNGDWHSAMGVMTVAVPAGDTVLAAQGSLGIAAGGGTGTTTGGAVAWPP